MGSQEVINTESFHHESPPYLHVQIITIHSLGPRNSALFFQKSKQRDKKLWFASNTSLDICHHQYINFSLDNMSQ